MSNILDITVSGFANYIDKIPKDVNLYNFLISKKYSKIVDLIRSEPNKTARDKIKATLPAITPSGVFLPSRKDEYLIKHSGLICIDIDRKGNECLNNYTSLKDELCKIPFVAYCGLSVSGTGYFVLIPIQEPQYHREYFNSLYTSFLDMNIKIDKSCVNVSRLRGYSCDPDFYINIDAKVWNILPKLNEINKTPIMAYNSINVTNSQSSFDKCINIIQTKRIDMTSHYNEWFVLLGSLANEFGERGRQYAHIISQYNIKYKASETDYYFTQALKAGNKKADISTFFKYCKDFGIIYKTDNEPKKNDYQKNNLNDMIKKQFSSLHQEYWILDKEKNNDLTNYNLGILCDNLSRTYKINVTLEEYYNTYLSINL